MTGSPLLLVDNLHVEFKTTRGLVKAVQGVSFSVNPGEMTAIVGESGSGKSVSAMAIMGLLPKKVARIPEGRVLFGAGDDEYDLLKQNEATMRSIRGKEIGMIFQEPMTSLNPVLTIGDQLTEPLLIHMNMTPTEADNRAKELLQLVGISDAERRLRQYPHEFSGGMRQRAVIALALCAEPALIIADEPTTALDVSIQAQVLDLLKRVCKDRGASVILITHDMGVISETTDRVAVLYQGKLKEIGDTRDIIERPQHSYTKALIACTPTIEGGSFDRDLIQIDRAGADSVDGEFNLREVRTVESAVTTTSAAHAVTEQGSAAPLLVADGLSRSFDLSDPLFIRLLSFRPKRILHAVSDVSFTIDRGTTYALVGESGSGKSTIARMAVGLLYPSDGTVTIDGVDLNDPTLGDNEKQALRRRIQMVFQSPYASLNPRWRVGSILAEPLRAFNLAEGRESARVTELLEQVGLSAADAKRFPHEFSGGQRQRISIARALASEPEFIICDEPTSALDVSVQAQVLNLLKQLQRDLGLTYLFITHDLAVVATMARKIGVLQSGRLVEEGDTRELLNNPQTDYTRMLIDSAPRL